MDEEHSNGPVRRESGLGAWHISRRSLAIIVAVVALIIIIAGYVITGPADGQPTQPEVLAATSLRRIFVPLHARAMPNPPTVTTAALLEGRKIFRQRCSLCHGGGGEGNASLGKAFYPPVPDLTGSTIRHWSDRDLFWTIQNGIRMTGMPAWRSSLSGQQTWDVVAYIRHMSEHDGKQDVHDPRDGTSDADLRPIALQTIDDEGCRDCHTIDGTGARVGPNLSDEWARGRSDAWLIGHLRHPSAYTPGTPMPSFDHLSDLQLKALVRYLQDSSK